MREREPSSCRRNRARSFDARLFLGVVALCILVSNLVLFYVKRDGLPYRDFKIFYSGARIFCTIIPARSFTTSICRRACRQNCCRRIKPEEALPYNHPPFELLLFLPLIGLPYSAAFYLWIAVSIACAIAGARMIGKELPRLLEIWQWMPYALVVCLFPFFMVILEKARIRRWRCFCLPERGFRSAAARTRAEDFGSAWRSSSFRCSFR